MNENVILKKSPKIEFQLLDTGFQLIDEQTENNSGFYPYSDVHSVELNKAWFPGLAKWLRVITWLFNGVPFFPSAESCKKASVIIHLKKIRLGLWLTDSSMSNKARILKRLLDNKLNAQAE